MEIPPGDGAAPDAGRRAPFEKMRFRGLLGFVIVFGFVPGFLTYATLVAAFGFDLGDPIPVFLFTDFPYLAALVWIVGQFRRRGVSFRGFLGPHPEAKLLPESLAIVFTLLMFTLGCLFAVYYPLVIAAANAVEQEASPGDGEKSEAPSDAGNDAAAPPRDVGMSFLVGGDSAYPRFALLLSVLTVVVFAPFVEELVFRGFLLHRWTVKWNLRAAVFLSSFLFALGHPNDLIGKFLFGVMMSFLYLKTRSLLLPIFCHMFHNGIALLFLPSPGNPPPSEVVGAAPGFQIEVVGFGLLLLVASAPLLFFFFRKYRPDSPVPPYFA